MTDKLNAASGVAFGLAICLLFWLAVAGLLWG